MILKFILSMVSFVVDPILSLLDFPAIPSEVSSLLDQLWSYFKAASGLINYFIPFSILNPILVAFAAVWAIYHSYQIVMWVLRKIPVLGID